MSVLVADDVPTLRLDFSTAPLQTYAGLRSGEGVKTNGRSGALVYGPYWKLRSGAYRLACVHQPLSDDPAGARAELHVWSAFGRDRIAVKPLEVGGVTELAFSLAQDVSDVEFAIMVEEQSRLEFRYFELTSLTPNLAADLERVNRRDFGYNLPFRHVVSLGTHCYATSVLQRLGWKRFSGPFDWIFSTPAMVRHCIEDDFQTLLDRTQYEPVPVEERPNPDHYRCHHRFYRDAFGVEYVFNHHDVWTDGGHGYIRRCVDRFLDVARSREPVLFLQVRWAEPDAVEQFAATVATIERHFQACTVNAFSVRRTQTAGVCPELRPLTRAGPHALFELAPVGLWESTAFQDPLDELVLARVLQLHRVKIDPLPDDAHLIGGVHESS